MNIRSGLENLAQLTQSSTVSSATDVKANTPVPIATESSDQAQLSAAAEHLAQASSSSDVRLDKVAAIQIAIKSGTYQVSASDVAQKVINALLVPNSSPNN
jgi:negative regulator of flagellin synthesis FlgM